MIPRKRQPRVRLSILHQVVLWGLLVFYLAASGRALVPGLCATIAAAEAQPKAAPAAIESKGSCCRVAGSAESDAERAPAPEGRCAFCHLVQTFAEAAVDVSVPEPWTPLRELSEPVPTEWPTLVSMAAPDGRAPPA